MSDTPTAEILKLDSVLSALSKSLMVNRQSGMGTLRDRFTQTEIGSVPLLAEHELRSLHRGNWWIKRIIETPAEDMTKGGIEIKGLEDAELAQKALSLYESGGEQSKYSRKLGGPAAFFKAEMFARWFGRGYIVLRVNGGEDLENPLEKVSSFEGFSVLDRYQLRPDLNSVNYEDPEYYQLVRLHYRSSDLGQDIGFNQRIHETRVLPFDGEFLHPYDIHLETADGGHDSVIQAIYECFCRHYSVSNAIAKGLDSYSLFKVAINGLSSIMMSDKGEQALSKTLDSIAQMISLHRILVQDGAATNSEFQERTFSGVAENAKSFREELTAASGLPHYKLWGSVDKSSLADSGGAESRAWAETVNSMQHRKFKPNHRRVFNALFEALTGEIPEGYTLEYPSIYTPTPEEVANLKKTDAERYQIFIDAGVVSAEDVAVAISTDQDIANVLSAKAEEDENTVTASKLARISKLLDDELITAEEARKALATGEDVISLIPEDGAFPEEKLAFEGGVLPGEQAFGLPSLEEGIAQLEEADGVREDARKRRKSGKKNCVQGMPCGNSCIARSKVCRKGLKGKSLKAAKTVASGQPTKSAADRLSDALAVQDFDAAAVAADEIYNAAKVRAQNAGGNFYDGIRPGNARTQDWILAELYAQKGFDAKPRQVSAKAIDNAFNRDQVVAYRAVGSSRQRFDRHFNQFKNGDYMAGHGIYGHGTYVAWAQKSHSGHTRLDAVYTVIKEDASNAASSYGNGVWRMAFNRNTRIQDHADNKAAYRALDLQIQNWYTQGRQSRTVSNPAHRRLRAVALGDGITGEGSGRLATLQGF